jgi:NCAIR mutase (PurE)-related protein
MNTNDNKTNNAGAVASTIGGAAIAGGLATTLGTGAGIVAAPVIGVPLAVVFGAGYLASSAWDWLWD